MNVHVPHPHRAEIRLAGSGGQGLITGMHILFRALALEGKRAAQSQSYEPTSRGGFCYSDLVVSDELGDYPLATRLDMVAALSQVGLDRSLPLLRPGALVIVDERLTPDPPREGFDLHVLPILGRAVETGSPRIANVVALGALAHLGRLVGDDALEQAVRLETPAKYADLNLAAVREGLALVRGLGASTAEA
ncbi:2-oxoglutarate ferredoxin oxidoreductase subunit gamma [Roseiarcus fermentans]|uniref:2-oxoglutarate ferredoxin oxidoreductase subunit gamma n=1 Tax=Roseiarcus fermentans TaxID=1473586 RepID=A0A366EPU4_9HYPH|nr:2-oxoacid:acceptor oxidoreductase family protein [Roseiarcus fermentans]RBP03495.1 2-oxoglutarate ferredoxin oxidoreductase subunit gamma [Roseiarcus fermentans]